MSIHEILVIHIVHWHEVVTGIHLRHHSEVVHLVMHLIVLVLSVEISRWVVVHVVGHAVVGEVGVGPVVDLSILTYTEHPVHVFSGDSVLVELEAELMVA